MFMCFSSGIKPYFNMENAVRIGDIFKVRPSTDTKFCKVENYLNAQRKATGSDRELACSDVLNREAVLKQLKHYCVVKTDYKAIADLFKKFGFIVTKEFNDVSYIIVA